jgi:hypothetical protein
VDDIADDNFLPVIKTNQWRGRQTSVCRKLSKGQPDSPLVAYGWDSPESTAFLTPDGKERGGWSLDQVNKAAIRNLARRGPAGWTKQRLGKGLMLLREGDEHTAAGVLLPRLLREAQALLKSELVVVGLPSRFAMWACDPGLFAAGNFIELLRTQHDEAAADGLEPVSPYGLTAADGKVVGMVLPADRPADGGGEDRVTWERPRPRVDAAGALIVLLSCRGLDEATQALKYEMDMIVNDMAAHRGWKGPVRFLIDPEGLRPTPHTKDALARLEEQFEGLARRVNLKTPGGQPVKVSIRFAEEEDLDAEDEATFDDTVAALEAVARGDGDDLLAAPDPIAAFRAKWGLPGGDDDAPPPKKKAAKGAAKVPARKKRR